MEKLNEYKEKAVGVYKTLAANPVRSMKIASSISGVLLIFGGVLGVINIFNGPLGMVLSAYNILFGLLVVITELKSWPIIKTFQKRVDVYFHLLSVPRGKGFFYCFIGLLAFVASDWNVSRVCTLIVAIVGMLHFLPQIAVEQAHNASDMENATEKPTSGFLGAMGATQGPTSNSDCVASLTSFAMEVVRDNPEAGKALATGTVNFATSNPGLAASAAGVLGGGVPGSTNGDFATTGSMSGVPGS